MTERAWHAACVLATMLFVAVSSPSVAAQELDESSAGQIFEAGLAAFDRGEPRRAVETWSVLLERGAPERAWRIHYNLGLAYEALGERARAIEHFEAFSRRVGEQPGSLPIAFEERRQDAVDRASRLRPFVGLLRIVGPPSGEPVLVRLFDGPTVPAGFSRYVEPGAIDVVMGEGPREVVRRVQVAAGELLTVVAEQGPPPPPPPPPPYEPPIPNVVVGVAGGVSLLALALPVALYVRASDVEEEAAALPTFDPAYPAARTAFEDARVAYQASYALPAGLAAVTLALLIANLVDASSDAVPVAALRRTHDGATLGVMW